MQFYSSFVRATKLFAKAHWYVEKVSERFKHCNSLLYQGVHSHSAASQEPIAYGLQCLQYSESTAERYLKFCCVKAADS